MGVIPVRYYGCCSFIRIVDFGLLPVEGTKEFICVYTSEMSGEICHMSRQISFADELVRCLFVETRQSVSPHLVIGLC